MSHIGHITALILAPPATEGGTGAMYLTETPTGSVLATALDTALTWPVDERILVLGDDAETLLDTVSVALDVVIDPEWKEGPAAALRVGFDLVARADVSDAVLVTSLDRTMPDAETVAGLIETARTSDRPLAAAKYRYAFDYPYLVHSELWSRFLGLEGSISLGSLVATHPEWIIETWIDRVPPRRYQSSHDVTTRR